MNDKIVYHWLYDKCEFETIVKKESSCLKCIHNNVCKSDYPDFCLNYIFGTSDVKPLNSCQSCLHKYTRFDKDKILCFRCRHFRKRQK